MTEKETDALLALETRTLCLENGSVRDFTMMKVYWRSADYLGARNWPVEFLAGIAIELSPYYRTDPDTALAAYVHIYHRWMSETLDVRIPFSAPINPLFHLKLVRSS